MRRDTNLKKEKEVTSPLSQEFNKTSAEVKELVNELKEKRNNLKETSDEYFAVSNKLTETQKEYNKHNGLLDKAKADLDSVTATKEQIEKYIAELGERKSIVDSELTDYKRASLLKQEAYKDELEKEKATLSKELRKFESTVTERKIELDYLDKTIAKAKDNLESLKEKETLLSKSIKEKEKELEGATKVCFDTSKQLADLSNEVASYIGLKQELLLTTAKLTKDVEKLREESGALSIEINSKKMTMGKLFIKEEQLKEQAHLLKDFYIKNGMNIPPELKF